MVLQGFADARTETSAFIFGKVDLCEAPIHFHVIPPLHVKKSPLLNLKGYTLYRRSNRLSQFPDMQQQFPVSRMVYPAYSPLMPPT